MVKTIKYKYKTIFFNIRFDIDARLFFVFIIKYIYKFEKYAR